MYKFLVVDDDDTVRMIVTRLLTKNFECEISIAKNGLEALYALSKEIPDIVFLDVTMPVMDGIETLEAIRTEPKFSMIPVIILTSISDKTSVSSLVAKGVSAYLLKPINFTDAPERIRQVLAQIDQNKMGKKKSGRKVIDGIQTVLVVGKDSNFRSIVKSSLGDKFTVVEATTGLDGFSVYLEKKPHYILITEKLELLNEKLLAQRIKKNSKDNLFGIYFVPDHTQEEQTGVMYFDGVLAKAPEQFLNSFNKVVLDYDDTAISILEVMSKQFNEFLLSTIKQIFSTITKEDVVFQQGVAVDKSEWRQVSACNLLNEGKAVDIAIQILSKNNLDEKPEDAEKDKMKNVLKELIDLVANHTISSSEGKGITLLRNSENESPKNGDYEQFHKIQMDFKTINDEEFSLIVCCNKLLL